MRHQAFIPEVTSIKRHLCKPEDKTPETHFSLPHARGNCSLVSLARPGQPRNTTTANNTTLAMLRQLEEMPAMPTLAMHVGLRIEQHIERAA